MVTQQLKISILLPYLEWSILFEIFELSLFELFWHTQASIFFQSGLKVAHVACIVHTRASILFESFDLASAC